MSLGHPTPPQALLNALDRIASTHGSQHPELLGDLRKLRQEIVDADRRNTTLDLAKAALQIATWVKFIYDLL